MLVFSRCSSYATHSDLVVNFIVVIFFIVVAMCDLVHDVETLFHFCYLITASGNLFLNSQV